MALSAAEQSIILEIIGLPESGKTVVVTALVHYPFSNADLWTPTYNTGDLSGLVAAAKTLMVGVSAGQEIAIRGDLTRWAVIGPTDPTRIERTTTGAAGCIVDYELERQRIRLHIGNCLGLAVPEGGFIAEIRATYGKSLGAQVRGGMGDR
jgi:hypothetical protein